MDRLDYKIYVPKDLIINSQSSGLDIMLYIDINIYGKTFFNDPVCLSHYTFADKIFGNANSNNKKIKDSFLFLANMFPKSIIITDIPGVIKINLNEKYEGSKISDSLSNLDKIMNSKYSFKLSLIKYYLLILSSVRGDIALGTSKYFATNYGIKWFAEKMALAPKTISLYTTCLEKLKLIYVYRDTYNLKNNIIGRYEDKELIEAYGKLHSYGNGSISDANYKRSVMAKYNWLVKQLKLGNACPYSVKELKEIRAGVVAHNEYCKTQSKLDITYLSKIKDIAIIDNIAQN